MWIYFIFHFYSTWDHNYSVLCVDQTECQTECQVSVDVYDIFYACIIYV